MDRFKAEDLIYKINVADKSELDRIGLSISQSNTHPKVVGILYKAIDKRKENIARGLGDPLVVHSEVDADGDE